MKVSLGLFPTEPPARLVELARQAEELGFARVYVGDSQMIWREAFVLLGAIAQATSRIGLATGVTNPVTRDPAVLAAAAHTLHELSGGRVLLGLGTGDSSVETLGRRPASLAQLEQAVALIRALLAGQEVKDPVSGATARLTYARAGGARVPVYLAVSSPRIHRLAGRIADGAIVLVGVDPEYLRASRRALAAGAEFRLVCWTPCSIDEDGAAARSAVKAHVARVLKRRLPFALDAEAQAVAERVREQYAYYEHMRPGTAHAELVPDALVERFAVAGTPAEARAQLRRLAASGLVDEIALIPHTANPARRAEVVRIVGEMLPGLGE